MHTDTHTVKRVPHSRDQSGDHEYLITGGDGALTRVYASTPARAVETMLRDEIATPQRRLADCSAPDAAYAAVGRALQSGGVATVDRLSDGVTSYIRAAAVIGYVAETHTDARGALWLRVAMTTRDLGALKSRIDRGSA